MRILVVDDEEGIVEVTGVMLVSEGHSVETATNGDDAFRIYCEHQSKGQPFDFVLTGFEQPGMDGFALMHAIWEKNPTQNFGFSTAYPVLQKPYEKSQLLDFIKRHTLNR